MSDHWDTATQKADVPESTAEVPRAIDLIDLAISKLTDRLSVLNERLYQGGVMRGEEPTVPDAEKLRAAFSTGMANRISNQAVSIDDLTSKVISILERLEV